jgi:multisubunit Na+/H+ antiporter MnhF subunit
MGTGSYWHWIVLLVLILAVIAVIYVVKRNPKATDGKLVGVSGWLIIPIIGFVGTILLTGVNLVGAIQSFAGLKVIFTDTTGQYSAMRIPVALSLLFGLAVVVSASICLYRIFVSKTGVKKIAVLHYVVLAAAGLVELWGDRFISANAPDSAADPSIVKDAVRGVLAAAIWIPYFMVSKRVANTFENGASPVAKTSTGVQ